MMAMMPKLISTDNDNHDDVHDDEADVWSDDIHDDDHDDVHDDEADVWSDKQVG